jgi:glutathione-regulated potassium-efflux system ancillary protein KefG
LRDHIAQTAGNFNLSCAIIPARPNRAKFGAEDGDPVSELLTPENGLLLVLAHPAMERSRANRAMIEAVRNTPRVTVMDLYETYPDFVIDVRAEQGRLVGHAAVALQFPIYWYSTPALLKEWLDVVWLHGFAFGRGGVALKGKPLLVACSTGGDAEDYRPMGAHQFSLEEFLRPLEQTAALCGMAWQTPFVLHASSAKDDVRLAQEAQAYRRRVIALSGGPLQ